MNQNGTDQHTTHQEKRLGKVEDNYSAEKKITIEREGKHTPLASLQFE